MSLCTKQHVTKNIDNVEAMPRTISGIVAFVAHIVCHSLTLDHGIVQYLIYTV